MAEDFITTKLNPESHLLLEQPLLRLPYELSRKDFKAIQKQVEHDKTQILSTLKTAANESLSGTQTASQTLTTLDSMITRLESLKRKMQTAQEDEKKLHAKSRRRIEHLGELYGMQSLLDVRYEEWSRTRLNRLLVDYLVRFGHSNTAKILVERKGLEELTDVDVFEDCYRINNILMYDHGLSEALAWCSEHKALMKKEKGNNALEFHLRLQQFIEFIKKGKLVEAKAHMQRYIAPQAENYPMEVYRATGLFAYPPSTKAEPYKTLYSSERWNDLAKLFVKTHHELFALPKHPLLQVALWGGLAALKTPSCHSAFTSSTANARSASVTVCPICSRELNELARSIPYAHHSKSFVENDPVVLPNGRVYGRERLKALSAKIGVPTGHVKDPTTGEVYKESEVRQIYFP